MSSAVDQRDLNVYDVDTMREIGVRQLKATLSEVLRAVERGETVRVTSHGRPIAELRPPKTASVEDRLWQLAAQGKATPPRREGSLTPYTPGEWRGGGPLPSETIIAEREELRPWEKG